MKRTLCFAVAVFAICLLTTFTYAQSESLKLRFNIPFAFTVENTTFAAGEYEITEPSHLLLELRNVESQAAAFEHAQPARTEGSKWSRATHLSPLRPGILSGRRF